MAAHIFRTREAALALAAWLNARDARHYARALPLQDVSTYKVYATPLYACDGTRRALSGVEAQRCRDLGFTFPARVEPDAVFSPVEED